ncbi:PaaI family thioesterase [uncultured Jatrophihabitans sp.]|uniref:PaaI family thioesterase n=1 Tax=uncultured Jatrophihabitans sp. TaxID=1610747 RepID=UPI0035CC3377
MSGDATTADGQQPWPDPAGRGEQERGGVPYAQVHRAQRRLQDLLTGAALPPSVAGDVTARLAELAELCALHQVSEHDRLDGMRPDLPGRGHPMLPPYVVDSQEPGHIRGRVTFGRFHLGGNGVVHGGVQPLLFDDVLGMAVNRGFDGVARTAYLHVDYRWVTPIDVELTFEATRDSVDGRKRYGSGRLLDPSGRVLSKAEALFVQLLPGQP